MSTLGWFVFRSRRQACDQLIEFLSTHPEHPRDEQGPPPDDPLDQRASPYSAAQLLAGLAQPEHADGLRVLAEDAELDLHLRLDAYTALVRVAVVPVSTRRIVFARCIEEITTPRPSEEDSFDSYAWNLAHAIACDPSPAALRDAERAIDRLEPAARVSVLMLLPHDFRKPAHEMTTHLLAHFAERFWLCDRPALEAAERREAPNVGDVSPLAKRFALATARTDRRSRELLFEAWAREPDDAPHSLLGSIVEIPGFVDYVAASPSLLARAASEFRLPPRVLVEHFGPATLVRHIESAVRAAWAGSSAQREWALSSRARRAVDVLATLSDAQRVACSLLEEYCQQPCADPRAERSDSLVSHLVELLWSRDPDQTVALSRSVAERFVRGALVRSAVLAYIKVKPAPAHRDELMHALRNGRTPEDTWAAIRALESLGERGPEWLAALRRVHPEERPWRLAERAAMLMRLGDIEAEQDLARMAWDSRNRARVARAVRALAPRVANHRALFEWIVLARPLTYCPCCEEDADVAMTALGTLGDEAARTTVFRAAVRHCEPRAVDAAIAVLAASS